MLPAFADCHGRPGRFSEAEGVSVAAFSGREDIGGATIALRGVRTTTPCQGVPGAWVVSPFLTAEWGASASSVRPSQVRDEDSCQADDRAPQDDHHHDALGKACGRRLASPKVPRLHHSPLSSLASSAGHAHRRAGPATMSAQSVHRDSGAVVATADCVGDDIWPVGGVRSPPTRLSGARNLRECDGTIVVPSLVEVDGLSRIRIWSSCVAV